MSVRMNVPIVFDLPKASPKKKEKKNEEGQFHEEDDQQDK